MRRARRCRRRRALGTPTTDPHPDNTCHHQVGFWIIIGPLPQLAHTPQSTQPSPRTSLPGTRNQPGSEFLVVFSSRHSTAEFSKSQDRRVRRINLRRGSVPCATVCRCACVGTRVVLGNAPTGTLLPTSKARSATGDGAVVRNLYLTHPPGRQPERRGHSKPIGICSSGAELLVFEAHRQIYNSMGAERYTNLQACEERWSGPESSPGRVG